MRNGVIMIKFNSNLVNFFDIFGISIFGINRNANTLIQYLKEYLILLNNDILQSPNENFFDFSAGIATNYMYI